MPRHPSQAAAEGMPETDPLILQNEIENNLYRLQRFLMVLSTLTDDVFFRASVTGKPDHADVTKQERDLTSFLVHEMIVCTTGINRDVDAMIDRGAGAQ